MQISIELYEHELARDLWGSGLLDVLSNLALDMDEERIREMVDEQYSGSLMHDAIPAFLRMLADEMEKAR